MNESKVLFLRIACFFLVSSVVSAIVFPSSQLNAFQRFVLEYKRQYPVDQYSQRKQIFLENVRKIEAHNSLGSFKLGVNQFADFTHEEYERAVLSQSRVYIPSKDEDTHSVSSIAPPPETLDWRTADPAVVGPVVNQGQCGSADAINIFDSVSGDYSVEYKVPFHKFDPSIISNCTGNGGCNGGTASAVWSFISKFGLQWDYHGCPKGKGEGICISGTSNLKSGDEKELQDLVASKGPVAAGIDASHTSFQLYKSGIYYEASCSASKLDHSVLIVGYGSTGGQDYWIARNTWGTEWGEDGYIRLARNRNNNCGVATSVTYPRTVANCTSA